jgi:hypothetical protein
MTMTEAYAQLPADAKWSCSFGQPGNGGFEERFRQPNGTLFVISNGQWFEGDNWSITKAEPQGIAA